MRGVSQRPGTDTVVLASRGSAAGAALAAADVRPDAEDPAGAPPGCRARAQADRMTASAATFAMVAMHSVEGVITRRSGLRVPARADGPGVTIGIPGPAALQRSRSAPRSLQLPREPQQLSLRLVGEHRELPGIEPHAVAARTAVQRHALVRPVPERRSAARALHLRAPGGAFGVQLGALLLQPLGVATGEILVLVLAWLIRLPHVCLPRLCTYERPKL